VRRRIIFLAAVTAAPVDGASAGIVGAFPTGGGTSGKALQKEGAQSSAQSQKLLRNPGLPPYPRTRCSSWRVPSMHSVRLWLRRDRLATARGVSASVRPSGPEYNNGGH